MANPIRKNRTIREWSDEKNVSPRTTYREIADGRLRTIRIRNRRLITPEASEEYDRAREAEARS